VRSRCFPWAATGAKHSFDTIPGDDAAFGPLVAEYAAEGARPE